CPGQNSEPPSGAITIRPPSTTTGTTRRPRVSFSSSGTISARSTTSISRTLAPRDASSARLAAQNGQPAFTYSRTGGAVTLRDLGRRDQRGGRAEHAAEPVADRHLRILHLARPTFPAQLPYGLDDGEDAVHAGVLIREPAAVRVHRECTARC